MAVLRVTMFLLVGLAAGQMHAQENAVMDSASRRLLDTLSTGAEEAVNAAAVKLDSWGSGVCWKMYRVIFMGVAMAVAAKVCVMVAASMEEDTVQEDEQATIGRTYSTELRTNIPDWAVKHQHVQKWWNAKKKGITMNQTSGPAVPFLYATVGGLALMKVLLFCFAVMFTNCGPDGTGELDVPFWLNLIPVPFFALWCYTLVLTTQLTMLPLANVAKDTGLSDAIFQVPIVGIKGFKPWFAFCMANALLNFSSIFLNAKVAGTLVAQSWHCEQGEQIMEAWDKRFALGVVPFAFIMMAASLAQLLWPAFRAARPPWAETETQKRVFDKDDEFGFYVRLGPDVFGLTVHNGDVTMLLSESVGFTFLQRSSIKYRLGRIIQRGRVDTEASMSSVIDIATALAKQIFMRFVVCALFSNVFAMNFQRQMLVSLKDAGASVSQLWLPFIVLCGTTSLILLDAMALSTVVGIALQRLAEFGWADDKETDPNKNMPKNLTRSVNRVLAACVLIILSLAFNMAVVFWRFRYDIVNLFGCFVP